MFRNLLSKLFGSREPAPDPPSVGKAVGSVPQFQKPILLFMESEAFLSAFSGLPTWRAVHVRTLAQFAEALPKEPYAMLIALSPLGESGAAGKAIRAFRDSNPEALTVYHGYDYRLSVSGQRALKCGADVLLVGGVVDWNLIYFLGTAVLLKRRGAIEHSMEFYTKLLQITCAESPFWTVQDLDLPLTEIE